MGTNSFGHDFLADCILAQICLQWSSLGPENVSQVYLGAYCKKGKYFIENKICHVLKDTLTSCFVLKAFSVLQDLVTAISLY